MVTRATTVEHHLFDAFAQRCLGRKSAEAFCTHRIGRQFLAIRGSLALRRRRRERNARVVVDELNVNVLLGKADAHPRPLLGAADLLADTPGSPNSEIMFFFSAHG